MLERQDSCSELKTTQIKTYEFTVKTTCNG